MENGINPLEFNIKPVEFAKQSPALDAGQAAGEASFLDTLRQQIDSLIEITNEAESMQQQFALGQVDDINEVVLAVQKADLALNFALELRNKVVEAYQEVSRMQI
jgi:flagellar hook-basal body complex protein FliE